MGNTPRLQALLEGLADSSATISEGEGNIEEDIALANVQHTGGLYANLGEDMGIEVGHSFLYNVATVFMVQSLFLFLLRVLAFVNS